MTEKDHKELCSILLDAQLNLQRYREMLNELNSALDSINFMIELVVAFLETGNMDLWYECAKKIKNNEDIGELASYEGMLKFLKNKEENTK